VGTNVLKPSASADPDAEAVLELRKAGCTCIFFCSNCQRTFESMDCPAWDPCPIGREKAVACPVHGIET